MIYDFDMPLNFGIQWVKAPCPLMWSVAAERQNRIKIRWVVLKI
jgi:hypothetical protein